MFTSIFGDSSIALRKSKFFILRALSYALLLLFPILFQKAVDLTASVKMLLTYCYLGFVSAQWYLLGKEFDHRFNVYFKVNSSIDRLIYRVLTGFIFFIVLFNFISYLPSKWIYNSFWVVWSILGLFYSWPTRGKIIKDSVASNLSEYSFLDSFERTLIGLILLFFFISLPEIPQFENFEQLKNFVDSESHFSEMIWNFLLVNNYPFFKYKSIFNYAIIANIYFIGVGGFLFALYALLRFFVSRRLSILGIFALCSSWSYTKVLAFDFSYAFSSTYLFILLWATLWVAKCSSYRVGVFIGLLSFYGSLINLINILIYPVLILLISTFYLKDKTIWFRRKIFRYSLIGPVLMLINYLLTDIGMPDYNFINEFDVAALIRIVDRKAFFVIGILSAPIFIYKIYFPSIRSVESVHFNPIKLKQFLITGTFLTGFALVFNKELMLGFYFMGLLTFLALLPIEAIFQTLRKVRSRRNLLFLCYVLICILDSHIEGRLKIFYNYFQ